MEDVKPIAIIYFPYDFSFGKGCKVISPLDLMQHFNGWQEQSNHREPIGGYLWFCFFKESLTDPEFKVFHSKDFTEIEYNELKEMVLKEIQNDTILRK